MLPPTIEVYRVSEITQLLQEVLQSVPLLQDVWVEGEISNFARPASGHVYFTLKDERSQIKCAIFRGDAVKLRFPLKSGDAILVHGRLSLYDARSEYQIIGDRVIPAGEGVLQAEFERLKAKLAAEGLFDPDRKRPLPEFPRKIGIITSATGAAFRDMLRMLQIRYPLVEVFLFPTLVQGEGAAEAIAHAIGCLNCLPDLDLLIVGRGGGSIEDLWAFNEEVVARALFASRIPTVSAVGHETDFTIADFVADLRAPTPSAAIEHIVPDREDLHRQVGELASRLMRGMATRLETAKMRLADTANRLSPARQIDAIHRLQQMVDQLESSHTRAMSRQIERRARALQVAVSRLEALSPLATLARGYSICRDASDKVITEASEVKVGDEIRVHLARGQLKCRVLEGGING